MPVRDFQYDSITLTYCPCDKGSLGAAHFALGTKLRPIVLILNFALILQTYFVMFTSPILSVYLENMDGHMVTSVFSFLGEWRV